MGSYRPFPPQPPTTFAPPPSHPNSSQTLPPAPPSNPNPYSQQQQHGNYGGSGGGRGPYGAYHQSYSGGSYNPQPQAPPPPQYQYQPPLPVPMYYPQQLNPSAAAPPSSFPPPPPPSSPPPPPPPSENLPPPPPPPPSQAVAHKEPARSAYPPRQQDRGGPSHGGVGQAARGGQHLNGLSGKVESEEERRARKRREFEKQRQEEKRRQMLKDSQTAMLQKTQMIASGMKRHGSMAGSQMADKKANPLLAGEMIENRLKKPRTFICKLKFRNELPDPTAQPKLLAMNTSKDLYTKYAITSLEKMHKPKLYLEPDLGIPLDLLDVSVYNPPEKPPPLAPEDQELLRDSDLGTPVKREGIRRKERPTDKGVSWLVKTQYISPLSTDAAKMSITEKQAKEMKDSKQGLNFDLENLNNREKQIQAIEDSFKVSKLRPVHQTNPKLEPVEILPLLPDLDRYNDRFVMVNFDGDPTVDSELFNKMNRRIRDEHEALAIMKSFVVSGSDPTKPERFLAYMVPSPDEVYKDIYDENEDVFYSWIREYHWDVRGDEGEDLTTYLVNFDGDSARYLPLPTKLLLRKRAKEGRSGEVEHYPPPSRVTVRRRSTVSVCELESEGYGSYKLNSKRGRSSLEDIDMHQRAPRMQEMDHFSGEEEMSD